MSVPRAGTTRLDVKNKKAVKTDPGGTTPSCEGYAPHSGSESDLTAFMLRVPRLCICADYGRKFQRMSIPHLFLFAMQKILIAAF